VSECKDIAILKDMFKNVKTSVHLNEVEQLIHELKKTVDKIRKDREKNLVDVSEQTRIVESEIHIPQTGEELAMMLISCNIWFVLKCKYKAFTFSS
jgi:benzoyl-CoA reductase/2-hydroxyglutaryl-CoA dehydratase subunit BcrC/BadD/HgdB